VMVRKRGKQARFCSASCRYRARDRARYEEDPESVLAKSRAYYEKNRDRVLLRMKNYQAARPAQPPRACKGCGQPTVSRRHWYCQSCGQVAKKRRGSRPERQVLSAARRGYGHRHQKLREEWERKVGAGGVTCSRCGGLISPDEPWDLGHADHDRSVYSGPEHRRCNRATAGRKTTPPREMSRTW
jgi:hypothetical protein